MSIVPSSFTAKSASACTSLLLATSQGIPTTFDPLCFAFKIFDTIASESAAMSRLSYFSWTSCWSSLTVSLTDSGLFRPGRNQETQSWVRTCSKLHKHVFKSTMEMMFLWLSLHSTKRSWITGWKIKWKLRRGKSMSRVLTLTYLREAIITLSPACRNSRASALPRPRVLLKLSKQII